MFYIILLNCANPPERVRERRGKNVCPRKATHNMTYFVPHTYFLFLFFGYAVNGYDKLLRATRYTTTSRMMATGDVRICERGRTRSSGTRKAHGPGGANSHTARGQRGVTHKHIVLLRGGQTGWYNIIS